MGVLVRPSNGRVGRTLRCRSRPVSALGVRDRRSRFEQAVEQATRENTYDNDGGVLEPGDTIVNVVAEGVVPPTLARFYAGAADVVAAVDPGPDVALVSGP